MLTAEEIDRQARHIMLKEIGGPGVQKLKAATVSLVGAGALGGPCAMYLAAAGIGGIEIWDDDVVERSNLQRQVQFTEGDIGTSKAEALSKTLRDMNGAVDIVCRSSRWRGDELAGGILIDATDNYETRFALNRLAIASKRYLVHGAAAGWTGQASTFAHGIDPQMPCYNCWVPETPPDAEACDEVGVVGPVTGMVSCIMALEIIKVVTGAGVPLVGRLLLVDGLGSGARTLNLRKDAACSSCG